MGKPDHLPPPGSPLTATELALRQPYILQTSIRTGEEPDAESSLTLTDLLHIVLKHKWTLLLVVVFATVFAGINTFLSRPTYRATVVLQIERAPARVVEFNNGGVDLDQISADEFMSLKTQYELLRSRSLAERVIDELQLDRSRPAGTAPRPQAAAAAEAPPGPEGFFDRLVSGYRKLSTPATTDPQILGREAVVGAFLGALAVEPVQNSRLVRLSIDNANPSLAAQIANATAQSFIAMTQERRLDSSIYAKSFLEDQIKQMKAKLEDSERKLNQYAQQKQILSLDEKTNVVNQTYVDFAAALARAEQERIRTEALYTEAKRNPMGATLAMENRAIFSYKERRAALEAEYQQNLRIYKPEYPKMQQIRAQLEEVDAALNAELNNIVRSLKTQFETAASQENTLRARLGQTRQQVLSTQDNSIDYNLLKREVETNRQLYEGLLQRLKQVGVSSNLTTNNISVVDNANTPLFPYKPNLRSNLLAGLAIGLFLGLCLVFLLEYMDDSIKLPDEIERVLGVPLMGVIPIGDKKAGERNSVGLEVHNDPRSTLAEAYRSVRTALQFSTSHGAPRRLVVTSTTRDEGKSTTALALAINYSQMGHKVLLVDADMRNPTVHKMLGIPNEIGLSNLLSADGRGETLIQDTVVPHLSVLTAGPPPPNPVDLLMGPKLMNLLDKASSVGITHVIVDAPPILGIADSIVLGNQIQDVLFVVRARITRKASIRDALRRLRLAGIVPRGAVLTFAPARDLQGYGSYYGYGTDLASNAALLRQRS